ncbi:MAG: UDP-N-acetylmuramate dehydrogenase [candidate division WOR-3 bacterium]
MKIYKNFDFSKISYIGIGHKGKLFIVENLEDLLEINGLQKTKILGNCSKILFSKKRYGYTFYKLGGDFLKIEKLDDEKIRVGGGVLFVNLMNFLIKENLSGFEELVGIPGTIGGMIKMNAGAFGKNISNNLISLETIDGKKYKKDLVFSYRKSNIDYPVIFATFKFEKNKRSRILKNIEEFVKLRSKNQPKDIKTLGSTFKNPSPDLPAWKLVDDIGMRGFCINDICVSEKHTNFLVNRGAGDAKSYLKMISLIQRKVYSEKKVKLELEVEIL